MLLLLFFFNFSVYVWTIGLYNAHKRIHLINIQLYYQAITLMTIFFLLTSISLTQRCVSFSVYLFCMPICIKSETSFISYQFCVTQTHRRSIYVYIWTASWFSLYYNTRKQTIFLIPRFVWILRNCLKRSLFVVALNNTVKTKTLHKLYVLALHVNKCCRGREIVQYIELD